MIRVKHRRGNLTLLIKARGHHHMKYCHLFGVRFKISYHIDFKSDKNGSLNQGPYIGLSKANGGIKH